MSSQDYHSQEKVYQVPLKLSKILSNAMTRQSKKK